MQLRPVQFHSRFTESQSFRLSRQGTYTYIKPCTRVYLSVLVENFWEVIDSSINAITAGCLIRIVSFTANYKTVDRLPQVSDSHHLPGQISSAQSTPPCSPL